MKLIQSVDELKAWDGYRDFVKRQFKLIAPRDTPIYVSKAKFSFEIGGRPWRGHAVLAGPKAIVCVRKLKKGGLLFREGRCRRKNKDLFVGPEMPSKFLREADKTLKKLRLGYKIFALPPDDAEA